MNQFIILLTATVAFAQATPQQISAAKLALREFVLPTQMQKMNPKQLHSYFKDISYQYIQPRDILMITADQKIMARAASSLIYSRDEGFSSTQGGLLKKGEFLRIIQKYKSNDSDFNPNKNYSGVSGQYIDVLKFTVIKLDHKFEPLGELMHLTIRGGIERKALGFKVFEGGFLTLNNSLTFNYAKPNDLIMNAQKVTTDDKVIPAFSIGIILNKESDDKEWSLINNKRILTVQILNCPKELKIHQCQFKITGSTTYNDPIWAHYIAPENRRQIKLWKATLFY